MFPDPHTTWTGCCPEVAALLCLFAVHFSTCPGLSMIEGSLETKVPTIWTDEKHSQEEVEPGRNSDVDTVRREKIRDGESQKREDAGA